MPHDGHGDGHRPKMADVKVAETLEDKRRQTLGVPSGLTGVRSPPGGTGWLPVAGSGVGLPMKQEPRHGSGESPGVSRGEDVNS